MLAETLKLRLKQFAYRCTKVCQILPKDTLGQVISKQLIRSAFSTAANYRAACIAQSKKSFTAKLSISLEEMDESMFWLEVITDLELVDKKKLNLLNQEALELVKILSSARKTAQKKIED
jgi:four helix bundle protein